MAPSNCHNPKPSSLENLSQTFALSKGPQHRVRVRGGEKFYLSDQINPGRLEAITEHLQPVALLYVEDVKMRC